MVQLWYPAGDSPAGNPVVRYLGATEREARIVSDGLAAYSGAPRVS
ncbi:hypothetical protein SSAG_05733 [Streptomyces sp. Mg1]|nr:hypothetical protein SSAG_05733 [Streptomyces sp. Mg1]